MTSEKLASALGQIDDSLVLEAMEEPPRRVHRAPWRKAALIAACFCLMAVVPAVAFTKQLWVQMRSDGWDVHDPEARTALSAFSPEVLDLVAELEPGEHIFYSMEDLAAAQDFLGVALPQNSVLDGARRILRETTANGQRYNEHCMVMLSQNVEGRFMSAWVRAFYSYWGMDVDVFYQLATEENTYINGGGFGWGGYEDNKITPLVYTTAAGREAQLFVVDESISGAEVGSVTGHGYVSVDDVLIELTVRGHSSDSVESTLKEILDAYE